MESHTIHDSNKQHFFESKLVEFLSTEQIERSLYAPFWYIDDFTNSFIEVKNNLDSELSVMPLITFMNGPTRQLDIIKIPPLSTTRVDLKAQSLIARLQLARLQQKSDKEPKSLPRWGDGSRENSLIGSAQLVAISPGDATSNAFAGWIVTDNQNERFGVVTTFENPIVITNPLTLEGLWWLPFPDTKAYFSFQNASDISLKLQVDLIVDNEIIITRYLSLEASSSQLIEIGEILETSTPPTIGGIRVTILCLPQFQAAGSFVIGRGRLVQESEGFASSLMLHESLGDMPMSEGLVSHPELHAPAAYFGDLSKLLGNSNGFMHPHLLLRNTKNYQVTVEVVLYGKDTSNNSTELRLEPINLRSRSIVHIDLQDQREMSQSTLADGVAGLRISHSGSPTDVIAELINVNEAGRKFAYYDAVKDLSFYLDSSRIAISFNLAPRHQSFLILKNITDKPQKARILLDYDDGKKHYDADLPEIPAQQVNIVDIKQIRDSGTPDRNGQKLPPDIENGGAAIFSEYGAFVISDPTFVFPPLSVPSLEALENIPRPRGPIIEGDGPISAPSCDRGGGGGGGRRPPPDQPRPSFRTVKIWMNAFIANNIQGQTLLVTQGNYAGKTMIQPSCTPGFCYLDDQRSFDSYIHASSRMHSEIVIDVTTLNVLYQYHHCDCTLELDCNSGTQTCAKAADTSRMNFPTVVGTPNDVIEVYLDAASRNECVWLTRIFGDIKCNGKFTINVHTRTVEFDGDITVIPSFEAYATADDGAGNIVFIENPAPNATPCDLPLMVMRHISGGTSI